LPVALIAVGLLFAVPARASAQADSYQYRPTYQAFDQRAYDNGFREGLTQGEQDARLRREFSFARNQDFRDADIGFRRSDGDLGEYRRVFRVGFEAGYSQGFDRTARELGYASPRAAQPLYPAYPEARAVDLSEAARIGFQDGYDVGRKDARDHESYDPVRSGRYRSADHDYDRRYGSLDGFKRDYRIGFEQGYEQGYRVGRH
jgi:hypothetical protein